MVKPLVKRPSIYLDKDLFILWLKIIIVYSAFPWIIYAQYKALHTILPQRACVVLHIYTLSQSPLLIIQSHSFRFIHAQGTITNRPQKSLPIARYLIYHLGEMCDQRNQPLITLSGESSANCQLFTTSGTLHHIATYKG